MKLRPLILPVLAALLTGALIAQAQVPGVNSTLNSVFTLAYDNSTMKQTFSASLSGISPVASASDVCTLSGSATKTIKVRRITFTSLPTTIVSEPIQILKRSTASVYTSAVALTKTPYDSSNAASTVALAEAFTANPTVGTLVGALADVVLPFGLTGTGNAPYTFVFGQLGQPIVLRGVAQSVVVNLNATTFSGTVGCTFEWTEE